MRLFYKLLLMVAISAVVVVAYDLLQVEIEKGLADARIRFDPATGVFTFRKPDVSVRIVYASMFNPGEPVMRVRDKWISLFEDEYSDHLAGQRGWEIPQAEKHSFVAKTLRRAARALPKAKRWLGRVEALRRIAEARPDDKKAQQDVARQVEDLRNWMEGRNVFLTPLSAEASVEDERQAIRRLIGGLEELAADPTASKRVRVAPLLVTVERRWQGRWVVSANRPRFLSAKEVPDIIVGHKMELLALVQDRYVVPLDRPLPGETVAPLDTADTYADPGRTWREAFIPAMLEEGKYSFLDDEADRDRTYLAPMLVYTYCIFYNEVLFEKAGIKTPPRTWPEFMAACAKLKSAGITPLIADGGTYGEYWMVWLILRSMGPELWEQTVSGTPADKPMPERRSDPPWTDPRYEQVFSEVRALTERGYFEDTFRGSQWPAAQKEFVKGGAAMMVCGVWLVQETAGYTETAGEDEFKMSCFSFPRWPGGREVDRLAAWIDVAGMMVCHQGKATPHAIELVKYLSAKEHPDMVHRNAQISAMQDADFSEALAGIRADFILAQKERAIYTRVPSIYARRFDAEELSPEYRKFFLGVKTDKDYLSVEDFLKTMANRTTRYLAEDGEEGY